MSPVPRQFGHLNDWGLRKFANPVAMSSCGVAPKAVSFPTHSEIKVGTLAGVLRQADISPDEFIDAL
jgi:hypothetical protein